MYINIIYFHWYFHKRSPQVYFLAFRGIPSSCDAASLILGSTSERNGYKMEPSWNKRLKKQLYLACLIIPQHLTRSNQGSKKWCSCSSPAKGPKNKDRRSFHTLLLTQVASPWLGDTLGHRSSGVPWTNSWWTFTFENGAAGFSWHHYGMMNVTVYGVPNNSIGPGIFWYTLCLSQCNKEWKWRWIMDPPAKYWTGALFQWNRDTGIHPKGYWCYCL